MKKLIFIALMVLFVPSAMADLNPFETVEESRQRHSAENYYRYKNQGVPFGGYPDKFGDVSPKETTQPGYNSKKFDGYDQLYRNNNK